MNSLSEDSFGGSQIVCPGRVRDPENHDIPVVLKANVEPNYFLLIERESDLLDAHCSEFRGETEFVRDIGRQMRVASLSVQDAFSQACKRFFRVFGSLRAAGKGGKRQENRDNNASHAAPPQRCLKILTSYILEDYTAGLAWLGAGARESAS